MDTFIFFSGVKFPRRCCLPKLTETGRYFTDLFTKINGGGIFESHGRLYIEHRETVLLFVQLTMALHT